MTTPRRQSETHRPNRAVRGFTLVELLVTIAIIALLLGIVVAGLFGAISFARRAAGTAQLQAIAQGIDAFQADLGFYPPLVSHLDSIGDDIGNTIQTPETIAAQEPKGSRNATLAQSYREARYMSEWTIGAFLIGDGDLNGDGDKIQADLNKDDGKVGVGIRNPGESRAWKSADGSHKPQITGREYGPYLDPGFVQKFIRRVPVEYSDSLKRIVRKDGSSQTLFQIVDAFDVPVRYYQGWITRDQNDKPTVLRLPIELRTVKGVEDQIDTGKAPVDPENALMTAPYALLAAGERADQYLDDMGQEVLPFGDRVPYIDGGTQVKHMQADSNGVFNGDSSDLDLTSMGSGDPVSIDQARTLLKFLKSNIRYAQ